MQARTHPGGCWPSIDQRHLLVAAFGDATRAAEAARLWWRQVDIHRIDPGSLRLLPQLYSNLVRHQLPLPTPLLREIHRRSWLRTQMQLRQLAVVLDALAHAGVETLVVKGAALAPQYFDDLGARPMADVDVVVPRAQVFTAAGTLGQLGWTPDRRVDAASVRFTHAVAFRRPAGGEVDLHWRVLADTQHDWADGAFWAASRPLVINGITSRALDPADELLVALVHGIQWNSEPSIRWIGDVLAILGSERIDWDRVVRRACDLQLVLPVRQGLDYLRDHIQCPVPDRVVRDLSQARVRWWEHVEMRAKVRPWSTPWAAPMVLFFRLFRSGRGDGKRAGMSAAGGFVLWRLGVDRARELPGASWRWLSRFRHRRRDLARPRSAEGPSAS